MQRDARCLWDVQEWREDGGGSINGAHLPGHIPAEEATAIFWAWMVEMEPGWTALRRGGPRWTYMRKVPCGDGWMQYVLTRKPGRGATPITYVEPATKWDAKKCIYTGCWQPVAMEFPGTYVIGASDSDQFPMCSKHAHDFNERLQDERRRLVALPEGVSA